MDTSIISIQIKDTEGEYNQRREFELQLPCTDEQFAALIAAISAILCPATK
jgi:hypothetical protein